MSENVDIHFHDLEFMLFIPCMARMMSAYCVDLRDSTLWANSDEPCRHNGLYYGFENTVVFLANKS